MAGRIKLGQDRSILLVCLLVRKGIWARSTRFLSTPRRLWHQIHHNIAGTQLPLEFSIGTFGAAGRDLLPGRINGAIAPLRDGQGIGEGALHTGPVDRF